MCHIFIFKLEEKHACLFAKGILRNSGEKVLEEHVWAADKQEIKTVGKSKMNIPKC